MTPGPESHPAAATAVTVVTGQRFEIRGSPDTVEAASGRSIAINPLHVVALEALEATAPGA